MFAIDEDNPFWAKVDDWGVFVMQQTIRKNKYITTTTETLKKVIEERSDAKVYIAPNYISDAYREVNPDNGDKIVIGYFGGASHYGNLNESNLLPALQRVMHEHKNVYFHSFVPFDYYLPRQRVKMIDGVRGQAWARDMFPELGFDISLAPLRDTIFNDSKSDIKWQESTRMGAAFVCSDIGPYKELKNETALRVNNTVDEWYAALKTLVEDQEKRTSLVSSARAELKTLETNWTIYRDIFLDVCS